MTQLPAGWAEATLAELGVVAQSGFPSGRHNKLGKGIPHLRPMNIDREGRIDLTDVKYVEDPRDLRLRPGDVLFNNTNSPPLVGKTAYLAVRGDFAFSNHMTRLRVPQSVDGRFLAIQLHFLWRKGVFRAMCSHHVNQASVSTKPLLSTQIALPPLAEQRRIVAAIEEQFSRLDAAAASLRAAMRRLDLVRDQAAGTAFDNDWPTRTLGEIAEIVGGVTKDAKRQSDPSFVEVPYLRVANVQRGHLDLRSVATIRVPPERARALALQPGDVLFNEGGDRDKLGRGWLWSGEIDGCIHQNHVFRARLQEGFEPKFVSWHGNTFGRRWFEEHGRQTTNLASLNLATLKTFPVPAPPVEEQRRIVAEVERQLSLVDALAAAVDTALRRSAALRRAILERAFAGELVPQDPSDEPASVLLERIAAEREVAGPTRRRTVRSGR